MKKINIAKQTWQDNQKLLQCPFCQSSLTLSDNVLVCHQRHTININKAGQINVLSKPVDVNYQLALFESRFNINQFGLFKPLLEEIKPYIKNANHIIDVGCGEGSHLNYLIEKQSAIGIDISKYGIQYAAKHYQHINWIVADLARMPIANQAIDVLFNCLTPANYSEFLRVLSKDGYMIKVIPNEGYLKELRERFDLKEQKLMKAETLKQVHQYFNMVEHFDVSYTYDIPQQLIQDLYHMTPLCWHIDSEILARENRAISLSMNFTVIIAKNKNVSN